MVPSTSLWARPAEGEKMQAFELSELIARRRQAGESWIEFLRVPSLSMGLYVLAAGSEDPQTPHAEDEVYYVVSGKGVLRVEGKDRPVREGIGRSGRAASCSWKERPGTLSIRSRKS
jgi:mannose-6-phosphate isomerase-like protein (cupin superfamily)